MSEDGTLSIDWDAPENMSKVRERVQLLLRGCSCKKMMHHQTMFQEEIEVQGAHAVAA